VVFSSSRNTLAFLLTLAALTPAASSAPTTNPTTDRHAVLARQREHYIETVKALPLLDKHRMSDLLQLQVKDRQLELTTSLTPWPDFAGRRVELDGIQAPASITYAQLVPDDPAARQFEFRFEDYPNGDVFGQLRLQWHPSGAGRGGDLSIEKAEQTSHSFLRVFYMQNSGMARLLVFSNDASSGQNMQSFNYMEKDFATLRRRHPSEIRDWLRPVLHWIQQDAVFAPDVNEAWQVLESEWPVTDQTQQAVARLLPQLNDERSSVRNRAADALAALGRDGASAIIRLDRQQLSLEQIVRLDEVVARFNRMPDDAVRRLKANPDFLLDCEYCPDLTVRALAAERLRKLLGHPTGLDRALTDTAKSDAVEKLREQFHPAATQPAGTP
jgi:hypothetical protein